MKTIKSFVLTPALPSSAEDPVLFDRALAELKKRNVETVEFFTDLELAVEYKPILKKYGVEGIYLAAALQKRHGMDLCAVEEDRRKNAVEQTLNIYEAGIRAGASGLMITSGRFPGRDQEEESWKSLERSIEDLFLGMEKGFLTMEPGDRSVDAMQLAGPTELTVDFAKRIRSRHSDFWLTMDTSHIAQLDENACHSVLLARECCRHVHFANCILKREHPLYGDKHPFFANPDAIYSFDKMKAMAHELAEIFDTAITGSIEIINREKDEWAGFMEILDEESWFFEDEY